MLLGSYRGVLKSGTQRAKGVGETAKLLLLGNERLGFVYDTLWKMCVLGQDDSAAETETLVFWLLEVKYGK